jgi:hypothetical protein
MSEALETEREIKARAECARRGIDPDEICADGGVTAWMVVDQERWRPTNDLAEAAARIEALEAALRECVDLLALVEHPKRVDPDYGSEVNRLGQRIGFGALMSSASASWRATLTAGGGPVGAEFVAGPCQSSVTEVLQIARAALDKDTGK